jgi:hypothetical protein
MALTIDSMAAEFEKEGGSSLHVLLNSGETRLAVKVKCSDNNLYRVSPVYSFVGAGEAVNLEVTRQSGPAKTEKLVLLYTEVGADDADSMVPFAAGAPTEQIILPLNVTD